ncbi:MAG: hypothetical protein KKE16_04180 [Firmicutes bacterium]|nr:hypothetical protein [Bacillota bacterium]
MKKLVIGLLVLFTGAFLFACESAPTTTLSETPVEFTVDSDVFALEALSAVSLMSAPSQTTLSLSGSTNTAATTTTDEEDPEIAETIDDIDRYMDLMERFLGDDDLLEVEVVASDNPDYAYMVTYTTIDLLDVTSTFVFYFNEVVYEVDEEPTDTTTTTTTTTEETTTTQEETTTEEPTTTVEDTDTQLSVTMDQTQEKNFYFQDSEDDQYVVYYLEGILVHGDLVYDIEGKLLDFEGVEVLRLYSYIDHDNYVRVQYCNDEETGEERFFYKVVEEGVIVSESKLRISTEEDGLNLRLDMSEGNLSYSLRFKVEEEEDVTIIRIMYTVYEDDEVIDSGHIKIYKTIDLETGEPVYDYKINSDHYQKEFEYHSRGHKEYTEPTDEAQL